MTTAIFRSSEAPRDLQTHDREGLALPRNRHCALWISEADLALAAEIAELRDVEHRKRFAHYGPSVNASSAKPKTTPLERHLVGVVGEIAIRRLFLQPVSRELLEGPDGGTDLTIEGGRQLDVKSTHWPDGKLLSPPTQAIHHKTILCQTTMPPGRCVLAVGWIEAEVFYEKAVPWNVDRKILSMHRGLLRPIGDALAQIRERLSLWRCHGCGLLVAGRDDDPWCGAPSCKQDPRWLEEGGWL